MATILYRAPAGYAGDITRRETTVEPGMLNPLAAPTAFGAVVKAVAGKFEKIAASDVAAAFYGILSRSVPTIAGDASQTFTSGTPNTAQVQGIVRRGYVNAVCTVDTPVRGGAVHMAVLTAGGDALGDLRASATVNTVQLVGVTWAVDGKDANNIAEIRIA